MLRAVLEACVKVDHMGEWTCGDGTAWTEGDEEGDKLSFVAAIWVRSEASSLRRSLGG